jgi:uncharacterized protein (TIGR02996 family)
VTTRDDLLAVIAADLQNREGWALYADWLQQHGDVRGELIALDLALEADNRTELRAARDELLRTHGAALLGDTFSRFHADGYGEIRWQRGFVVEIGYGGSMRLTHRRKVKWLAKLIVENPEPFTFLRVLRFPYTDLDDVTQFMELKHLKLIDVHGTDVTPKNAKDLQEVLPDVRVSFEAGTGYS